MSRVHWPWFGVFGGTFAICAFRSGYGTNPGPRRAVWGRATAAHLEKVIGIIWAPVGTIGS